MTMIVLGLDGGGSKTRVMVADENGQEIVTVEGAGSAVRPGRAFVAVLRGRAPALEIVVRDAAGRRRVFRG